MRKLVKLTAAIMIAASLLPQIGVALAFMENLNMNIHTDNSF